MINIFYLSPNPYGGWVTFTAHLMKSLEIAGYQANLFKIGNRTEKFTRPFGYNIRYRNVSLDDAIGMEGSKLIAAVGKKFVQPACALIYDGARIVIHDPTELWEDLKDAVDNPIIIRKNNAKYFNSSTYIPHPYVRIFERTDRSSLRKKYKAVSISRIDFDKHTEILLDANRLIKKERDRILIRGFENRLYTKFKIMPNYPEWEQSIAAYPREYEYAANLCRQARFMVDMSAIKGDGGGTQYTFLEAMDAGAVCILNREWFNVKGEMKEDVNCLAAADGKELVKKLRTDLATCEAIVAEGNKVLRRHAPKTIAKKYAKEFGL